MPWGLPICLHNDDIYIKMSHQPPLYYHNVFIVHVVVWQYDRARGQTWVAQGMIAITCVFRKVSTTNGLLEIICMAY